MSETTEAIDPAGPEMAWMHGGDTGMSSMCLWRTMLGVPEPEQWFQRGAFPYDPDDFGRCHRLLQRFPAWRSRLSEMAQHGAVWAEYASRWHEMEALFEEEAPTRCCPTLYALMKEIQDKHHGAAPHREEGE